MHLKSQWPTQAFYCYNYDNKKQTKLETMVHGCMVYTERTEIDSLWQQILVAPAMPAL